MPTPLNTAVCPNDAISDRTLFPSPIMATPQTTPLSCTPNLQFSDQLLLELGSLAPELENMLQAGTGTGAMYQEQWSTPQWNFNGLVSNPFVVTDPVAVNFANHNAALSTGNADTSLDYFSMAAHYKPHPAVGLSPLSLTPSPQSINELPLLPPVPSASDGM